jgi:hypothetical protein
MLLCVLFVILFLGLLKTIYELNVSDDGIVEEEVVVVSLELPAKSLHWRTGNVSVSVGSFGTEIRKADIFSWRDLEKHEKSHSG